MKKEQIEQMIDKKIESKFSCGSIPNHVVCDLITMTNNIGKVLVKENINIEDYKDADWDKIDKARVKYAIHYIKHCNKRIVDMDWIRSKKGVLSINYWEIWRLFVFKEKITRSTRKVDVIDVFKKQLERGKPFTEETILKVRDKNWTNGKPKKVGQIELTAFVQRSKNYFDLIHLSLDDIYDYEVDEDYCEKIGYTHMYIPYLIKLPLKHVTS